VTIPHRRARRFSDLKVVAQAATRTTILRCAQPSSDTLRSSRSRRSEGFVVVADRFAKNDSFILMVLDISGRVRPTDLHDVPEGDREASIASFYERHASNMDIHFEGDALVESPRPSANPALAQPTRAPNEPPPTAAFHLPAPAAVEPPQPASPPESACGPASDAASVLGATDEELALIGDAAEFSPAESRPQSVPEFPAPAEASAPTSPPRLQRKAGRARFHPAAWMWWWRPPS